MQDSTKQQYQVRTRTSEKSFFIFFYLVLNKSSVTGNQTTRGHMLTFLSQISIMIIGLEVQITKFLHEYLYLIS
jgi:hypothetical protein